MKRFICKTLDFMTQECNQFKNHQEFFKALYAHNKSVYYEDNAAATASFILEQFLASIPLEIIPQGALTEEIDKAYKSNKERS